MSRPAKTYTTILAKHFDQSQAAIERLLPSEYKNADAIFRVACQHFPRREIKICKMKRDLPSPLELIVAAIAPDLKPPPPQVRWSIARRMGAFSYDEACVIGNRTIFASSKNLACWATSIGQYREIDVDSIRQTCRSIGVTAEWVFNTDQKKAPDWLKPLVEWLYTLPDHIKCGIQLAMEGLGAYYDELVAWETKNYQVWKDDLSSVFRRVPSTNFVDIPKAERALMIKVSKLLGVWQEYPQRSQVTETENKEITSLSSLDLPEITSSHVEPGHGTGYMIVNGKPIPLCVNGRSGRRERSATARQKRQSIDNPILGPAKEEQSRLKKSPTKKERRPK